MSLAQPDLFASPVLPGLGHCSGLIAPAEEALLIAAIDAAPLEAFWFQGWTGKRLTASYGSRAGR